MTMGEQSVSAIMPKFRASVSGASLAKALPTQPLGKPAKRAVSRAPLPALPRKWRRVSEESDCGEFSLDFVFMIRGLVFRADLFEKASRLRHSNQTPHHE